MKKSELRSLIKECLAEGFQGDDPQRDGLSGFRGGNVSDLNYLNHAVSVNILTAVLQRVPVKALIGDSSEERVFKRLAAEILKELNSKKVTLAAIK